MGPVIPTPALLIKTSKRPAFFKTNATHESIETLFVISKGINEKGSVIVFFSGFRLVPYT